MTDPRALERLPMTMGYFRLILRCFADTPQGRRAFLEGTGVSENQLRDPGAEITLFQQVRQIENVSRELGEGWALTAPELWHHSSHGALGTAALTSPTLGAGLKVLERYSRVRGPYYRIIVRAGKQSLTLRFEFTAALEQTQWLPMTEVAFMGIRSLVEAMIGRPPREAKFCFACKEPDYAERVRAALGGEVRYGGSLCAVAIPGQWLAIESPYADPGLHTTALAELERALKRLDSPLELSSRVEQLLHTMPDGRLSADDAARAVGVSRRTLVRRLSDANENFRDLLDAELKRRAARLLKTATLSHAEIAERLGYGDATSFSRACRRWFR